jgi:hypothetical protein
MNSLVKSLVRSERWLSLSEIKSARIGGAIRLGLADKEGGINFRSSSWPLCCGMPLSPVEVTAAMLRRIAEVDAAVYDSHF